MPDIEFFIQDISFSVPKPRKTKVWIRSAILREKRRLGHLNYIFCSDRYLLTLNERYLNHKTLTDIITFDHSDDPERIEGDIFISVERVGENAEKLGATFLDELNRVMIHGVLHLVGYGDKSPSAKSRMRKKEDAYLSLRNK